MYASHSCKMFSCLNFTARSTLLNVLCSTFIVLFRLLIVGFALLTGKFSRHKSWQVDCRSYQIPEGRCVAGRFRSRQHSAINGAHAWCKCYASLDDASLCSIATRWLSSCYDCFLPLNMLRADAPCAVIIERMSHSYSAKISNMFISCEFSCNKVCHRILTCTIFYLYFIVTRYGHT